MEDWTVDISGMEDEELAPEAEDVKEEGEFTLRHLDDTFSVGRDEVIALAQKGLDYDRIREKLEAARARLAELGDQTGSARGGAAPVGTEEGAAAGTAREAAAKREREARDFVAAHPEAAAALLRGESLPERVWQLVREGESLGRAWERAGAERDAEEKAGRIRALEAELAETRQAGLNAARSAGSMASDGGDEGVDPIAMGWGTV